jgi:hypothetical protein
MKVDADGNVLWNDTYGGSMNETSRFVAATTDGGAIIAGTTESSDIEGFKGGQDILLMKVDGDGNLEWQRTLGSPTGEWPTSVKVLDDGNILVCGVVREAGGDVTEVFGGSDAWIVKLNGGGTILWQQTIGGADYESLSAMSVAGNKVYLAGTSMGTTGDFSSNHGLQDGWVVVINQP